MIDTINDVRFAQDRAPCPGNREIQITAGLIQNPQDQVFREAARDKVILPLGRVNVYPAPI
jgi:hypothetical protein